MDQNCRRHGVNRVSKSVIKPCPDQCKDDGYGEPMPVGQKKKEIFSIVPGSDKRSGLIWDDWVLGIHKSVFYSVLL